MRFRLLAVAVVALAFALTQASGGALSVLGHASAFAASPAGSRPASAVQADNGSNGNDNQSASSDNASSDNSDVAADNSSSDNSEVAADNTDTGASGSAAGGPTGPAIDDAALMQPLATASGTTTGGDMMIATPGERVAVRVFPWMPAGVQITIRPIDANSVPTAPGTHAGDLTFAIEARDASGMQLTTLPAEANLAVRYADATVDGLNESNLTLSRLDPTTNQWQAAPKLVREPDSNYVAASITQLGTYTVSTP